MGNSIDQNSAHVQRGIVRAFRISASIALGLVISMAVVAFKTERIPIAIVLPFSIGFVGAFVYRGIPRSLQNHLFKVLTTTLSFVVFAVALFAIWSYYRGNNVKPMDFPLRFSSMALQVIIGCLVAGYLLDKEPNVGPFGHLSRGIVKLRSKLGATVPLIEPLVFAGAVLVSFSINVPTLQPELHAILAGSSVIVTASIGWYAYFTNAALNEPNT